MELTDINNLNASPQNDGGDLPDIDELNASLKKDEPEDLPDLADLNRPIHTSSAQSKLSGAKEGDFIAVQGRDGKVSLKKMNAPTDEGASVLEDVDDVPDMNKTYPTLTADEWDAGRESGAFKMNVSPSRYRQLQHIAETGAEIFAGENGKAASVIADTLPFGGNAMADKERGKIARMERYVNGKPDLSPANKTEMERALPAQVMLGTAGGLQQIHFQSDDEQWADEAQQLGVKGDLSRNEGESVDAYHKRLQGLVKEQMEKTVSRQDWAKKELSFIDKDWKDTVFGEGRASVGYAGEFAVTAPFGGLVGGAAKAGRLAKIGKGLLKVGVEAQPVAVSHAVSDYEKFRENDYTMKNGELEVETKGDDPERALFKAIANNEVEAITEIGLGELTAPLLRGIGKVFNKSKATSWITGVGKGYAKIREATKFGDILFEELPEEDVQYFFSDVLGLGKKDSEFKGVMDELAESRKDGGMYTLKGQWNTALAMLLQMGGQAAVAAPGVGLKHIENNRQLANILEGAGMTKEQVANLSYGQREAFRRFHDHFADNPEKLKEALTRFDKHLAGVADQLVAQTTMKLGEDISAYKGEDGKPVTPHKFEVQAGADGKPAFKSSIHLDLVTGKDTTRNEMFDPAAGVTVVDNGDGTFEIYDEVHRERSFATDSFDEAIKQADYYALSNQKQHLDNLKKAEYARLLMEGDNAKFKRPAEFVENIGDVYWAIAHEIENGRSFHGIADIGKVFRTENKEIVYPPTLIVGNSSKGLTCPDGTMICILDNINTAKDMNEVLAHESGHAAGKTDAEGKPSKEAQKARQEMLARISPDTEYGRILSWMQGENERKGLGFSEDKLREEAFSRWLEQRGHNPSIGQRITHALFGNIGKLNDADLEVIASRIESDSAGANGGVEFIPTGINARSEPIEGEEQPETPQTEAAEPPQRQNRAEAAVEAAGARPATEAGNEPSKTTEAPTGVPGASGEAPRRLTSAEEAIATAKTPFNAAEKAALEGAADVSGIDATDEMPEQRDYLSILSKDAPVVRLNPAKVDRSDAILPNMKKDANRVSGITKPLSGEWHPTMGGIGAVWLTKDGKLVVITGRHRSELAERKGKSMLYYLYREADGFTKDNALIYDAVANIHDEKGTINDYLGFLDKINPTREQADKAGILAGKGLVAWSLYKDATEAVRSATAMDGNPGEGQISPQQATVIAEAAPRDADKRNPSIQRQLLKTALGGMKGKAFDMYARIRAEELSKTPVNENLLVGEQMDLFSSPEDQAADILAQRQSQYRTKKANGYGEVARNLRTALNGEGKLELNDEYAKELGVTDKTDRKQLEAAYDKAVERANYWENTVRLDEADKTAMDAEINATADARAKRLQELKAKREAAKSGKPKVVVSKNATTTPADETKPPAGETKPAAGETKRPSGETKKADSETKKPVSETQKPALGTENAVSETKTGKTEMSKAASKTPSIKMKDEAAEKLAQQQEDDLAALFDTPEFGIMRGDEGKRNKLELDENRLGGSLGIPGNAVPNRQLIEKVRGVLAVQGETSARTMRSGRISQDTAKALFDALNADKGTADLFKRVFPVAQSFGIEYSFAQYAGQNSSVDGLTLAQYERGGIKLFANTLQFTLPQTFASTILHETIHGVTVYAMEVYDGTIKNPKTKLTPELAAAAKDIFDIYKANKPWIEKDYGFTDAYEMIAELANPKFRERLKKKNIWQKIWDAIKRIFGFNTSNTHDAVAGALDRFVESYDKDVFDSYIKDSYRNNLDGDLLGLNTRFSMRKAEKGMEAATKYLAWAKKWKLDPSKKKNQREWAERNGVSFDTPEFDPDIFQKRVGAVAKLVKTYQDNGVADFKTLATRMAERFPEKFATMKPYLRGVWNAVADQMNLSDVSRDDAERIYGIIQPQAKEATNDRRRIRGEVPSGESAAGGGGAVGLAEGQPASEGGERGSGVLLAGGRVRGQDSDARVDGQRSGAVPRQPQGLADKGTSEGVQGGNSSRKAAEGNGSVADSVRPEVGERETGRDSSGDGNNPKLRVKKAAKKAADSTKPNPFRRDFVMTKAVEEAILEKSPINRIRQNIAAIKLIRELAQKDFVATPDEQATLAKYVGWGGLSEMFSWDYDRAWSMERDGALKSEVERMARRGKYGVAGYEAYKELRQTLNDEEYDSARASTTTAFYTPIDFVRALHDALRKLGVKGGRFLGPSAGVGNFASAAGEYEKPVNWQFVEKDQVTGMILKALFPNQRVNVSGFEETKFPDGFFDFAIDNVPYADVPITDRSLSPHSFKIHDYFFAKTLAKLRPGGVMAFLTSTGTLDKTSPILRQFLTDHGGKIVGAVRLPNGFFSENAGTDVASDLVIVQKVDGRPDNSAFERQENYTTERGNFNHKTHKYDQKPIGYNGYFQDHPEQIVGKMEIASGQFGPTLKYTMPEKDMLDSIGGAIARAFDGIDKDALLKSVTVATPEERAPIYDEEGLRQGNVTMKDGKPFIKSGEMLEPITLPNDRTLNKELTKRFKSAKSIMDGLISLRKAMRDVIDAQMRGIDDGGLKSLLGTLNEIYDAFVKKNGTLHDKWVTPFVMLDKADGNRMLALERTVKDENGKSKVVKSDIFTKRVISLGQRATKAGSPKEALIISYSETGGINIPRIATLLDTTAEDAINALKESGDAFENPQTGRLEPSWTYLSGRVRAKLAAARAAVEAGEESYRANVEALEKVQPPMVKLEDTEIKFGATWVDPECMKDFLRDAFGSEHMRISLNKNELTGQWNVEFDRVMNEDPWGETSWGPKEFVSRVLNHGSMEHIVTDPVDKKKYRDEKRTEANKLAADKLHSAFSQFIQSSEKWAEPMYERYNAVMTDNVGIKLPNNILPFRAAGMSEDTLRMLFEDGDTSRPKKGREYQSDVIARGVLGGSSLCLAHCVGAGKTLEMQAIGMLGRRLGMFKKSMYVVPNHMLDQFVNEFTRAFPNANLLKMTAEDVKPANRRAFFAQVANGDWDAIVVKHSTFSQKLGMSKQYQEDFMIQQKKDLMAAIEAMKESGDRISVKQGEKMLARLEDKLKKLGNAEGKDKELVPFEELGVDQLFVDEAHNFKGMPITTRQGRTGGLQTGDSQRAEDMHMKTQYVQSLHGGTRGVVFATGTPLSNAPVVEAYVMLKYLAPNKLAEQGLIHFDDFVDAFGRITTETDFSPDGKTMREKDRISAFVNIPDFMKLFKSVVDIVNSDQLDIPRPKPKYHMIDVDMSDAQRIVMEAVARESGKPAGKEWPSKYMDLTWVAKLACISPRMLGFADGGNKIIRAVSEVKKVYDETANEKGTQLIFTDRFQVGYQNAALRVLGDQAGGMAAGSADFNLNEEIRDLLVQSGIPKDEIAIVQDIDNSKGDKDANKEALFAKVRAGEVRVLIGSRPKMGEGTNVQERLAAIHLLHPGWKPSEDEQAIGRIIRNGNMFKEGQIFYYLTKGNENIGSYETKNHQLIGVKSKLIDQVMHSDDSVRSVEMDESAMDRDMLMGLASGNKALMELIDVKKRVHKLELNTDSTMTSARRNKDKAEANARMLERRREEFAKEQEGVKEWREKNEGKPFALSTPDGSTIDKVKDMAEYVSAQMVRELTKDRYDRDAETVLGNFNGVDLILAYDKYGDEKFKLAVPLLGVAREINYSGFIPDFSQAAMTAFKGKIFETVSPDFAKAYENSLADMDRQAKKMSSDADKLQKDYEGMREELIKLRTRQAELERAVTPLMVQALEDRSIAAYGNWSIAKDKIDLGWGIGYTATRDRDGKTVHASTVKELIPLMDAEDFASPANAATKTTDLRPTPNAKGEAPHVDKMAVGEIDFDTPDLSPAEAEYAEAADKTPTEKVMREVYGMTNEEIATALKAAGMEPPAHVRKPDETAWKQAEALLSNPSYMAKLSRAVAKFPRNIADYENNALNVLFRQRQAAVNAAQTVVDGLKETLDAFDAIPKDERDTEWNEEQQITAKNYSEEKAKLAQAKSLMYETGLALTRSSSEAGRRLRSNRGLIDQTDYSYAGISGQVAAILGGADKITPEMDARIREIAGDFASLDEQGRDLATARLKAQAEKIVEQIKNGDKVRKAAERNPGDEAKRVMRNYNDALAQIEVGSAEVGGTLVGLSDQQYPAWGKWLRAIGEYHCFANPDITEEECVKAIVEDISPFMDGVDENQVRDALTGFGHNFRQSRYDSQRLMNDLRSQARLKRQLDWMDETNTMPPLTGLVRDEPSDTTRNLQKQVQERKMEVPDAGRDERRLKGVLESAKTRVKNRIADLENAIATGEKIPGRDRTVPEDIELRALKQRKDELQKTYDELFKTESGMTDEQRVKLAERLLGRELEHALEDLDRARSGDFSKRQKRPGAESPTIDALRERLADVRAQIRELKLAKYEFGMTPEELSAYNARKMANREKALARLAERIVSGDIRPQKKPQPPMPADMKARYDALGEQMKKGRQKLADLRLEAENATVPGFMRKAGEYARFVTTAQRALRATMDFSAVLRQVARMTLAHPGMGIKSFGKAWNAAGSEADLMAVNDEIMSDPLVREAVEKFGLHLREVDATSARDVEMFHGMERNRIKLFGKEFAITDIPFFGKFMLKSERHYITYLNAISTELYTSIVNDKTRFPAGATAWQKKMVADMINIWNGSAALSKERRQALQKAWVNDIFWAPQLAISRVQSSVGYDWWRPLVAKGVKNDAGDYDAPSGKERITAAKIGLSEHLKSTIAMIALGALLKWIFADDDDWYNFGESDWFEKMMLIVSPKVGNTTIDLTGGESSFYRAVHQIATQSKRSGTGRLQKFGDYGAPTTMGVVGRYLQGKMSPWLSELTALWEGRDFVGEEYTLGKAVYGILVPLTFEDIKDQLLQNGVGTTLVTAPLSLLGAGGSTYDRKPYENAVNRFKTAVAEYEKAQNDRNMDSQYRNLVLEEMRQTNPLLDFSMRGKIAARISAISSMERAEKEAAKKGQPQNEERRQKIEAMCNEVLQLIRENR